MRKIEVLPWADIRDRGWPNALIGNGLSRRFSDQFAYSSLFEQASRSTLKSRLRKEDRAVFKALKTTDFETVLSALATTALVHRAWGWDVSVAMARYKNIRNALVEVIREVHPDQGPYLQMLGKLQVALADYKYAFTTNYDLLIYWALMRSRVARSKFNDYFRSASCEVQGEWVCFERRRAEHIRRGTNVLYLHGALHLYEMPWGQTVKFTYSEEEGRLLDRFARSRLRGDDPVSPVFVSEGSGAQKQRTIRQSDYLRFAFDCFAEARGNLLIFGSSLGEGDDHLIRAIADWPRRSIAYSVRRDGRNPRTIHALLASRLPDHRILLFDPDTHPLGRLGSPPSNT